MEISETVIWLPAPEFHDQAAALGLLTGGRLEYEQRVATARAAIEGDGGTVAICTATPDEVLEVMRERSIENTPQGRAEAFAVLGGQ